MVGFLGKRSDRRVSTPRPISTRLGISRRSPKGMNTPEVWESVNIGRGIRIPCCLKNVETLPPLAFSGAET